MGRRRGLIVSAGFALRASLSTGSTAARFVIFGRETFGMAKYACKASAMTAVLPLA